MKYEESIRELEKIVSTIENGDMDIDDIITNIKRAQKIIGLCKDKLTKTDNELEQL